MASLRMAFKLWLDGEPEDLGTDRPSDDQIQQYEQAETEHAALVRILRIYIHLVARPRMIRTGLTDSCCCIVASG